MASSQESSGDEGDRQAAASHYLALVASIKERQAEKAAPEDLEITWDTGLRERTEELLEKRAEEQKIKSLTVGEQ